jgi:beta-aspartyl-peptidase (threonine type)
MSELIRLALHGGAGDLPAVAGEQAEHRAALHAIASEGLTMLRAGAAALDAVEQLVLRLEECPLFNAGIGAVLNRDGLPELDAAIMDGRSRAAGAVAGVMRSRSPVRLARAVMERSPHVLFSGPGAEALGRELGLPEVTPDYFITEQRFLQLKQGAPDTESAQQRVREGALGAAPAPTLAALAAPCRGPYKTGAIVLDHDSAFGTVGAVVRDAQGHLAAATSTGGLTNKHPGRIGDSPIIGAGTWADDRSVAVSCTGTGECFMRAVFSHEVHARLLYGKQDLRRACAEALEDVKALGGRGGCIAIGRDGAIALPFNSQVMYRAWCAADGQLRVAIAAGE